jgi:hypothetical protein
MTVPATGAHQRGQRGIRKDYPVTSGLTVDTTKTSDREINLVPSEGSSIPESKKVIL